MDGRAVMGTICKHCGGALLVVQDGVWGHAPYGVGVCQDIHGKVLSPMRFAEPTQWTDAE